MMHMFESKQTATKKFFRKIYSTATLPNSSGKKSRSVERIQNKEYYDQGYGSPLRVDATPYQYRTPVEQFRSQMPQPSPRLTRMPPPFPLESEYEKADANSDSGLDERSSTRTSTSTRSDDSGCRGLEVGGVERGGAGEEKKVEDMDWDDVFKHLKREMTALRARDAKILADLHRVEHQLHTLTHPEEELERELMRLQPSMQV